MRTGPRTSRALSALKFIYTTSFVKESSGRFLDKYTNPYLSRPFERLLQNVSRQMPFTSITIHLRLDLVFISPEGGLKPYHQHVPHMSVQVGKHSSLSWDSFEGWAIHQVMKVNTFKHVQSLKDSVKRAVAISLLLYRGTIYRALRIQSIFMQARTLGAGWQSSDPTTLSSVTFLWLGSQNSSN